MLPTCKYFFSILLALATTGIVFSQEDTVESVRPIKPADTVKSRFLPTGVRLGTDVISIIKSRSGNNFSGWEANADVDFYRYYLTVDYGSWSRQVFSPMGIIKTTGLTSAWALM